VTASSFALARARRLFVKLRSHRSSQDQLHEVERPIERVGPASEHRVRQADLGCGQHRQRELARQVVDRLPSADRLSDPKRYPANALPIRRGNRWNLQELAELFTISPAAANRVNGAERHALGPRRARIFAL
jgi:hypothetical protein